MKAIVLAGGFATRLRPLTFTKPKALLPILDKPLLDWILEGIRNAGIRDVIVSVRYLANQIKSRYGDGADYGLRILYAEEERPLGDAGPLKFVHEKYGLDETFIVIYGDVFSDIDLRKMIDYHRKKNAIATLALAEVYDPSRYGIASLDSEGRIINFVEKPSFEEAPSRLANAGVYIFEPEVVRFIPEKPRPKLAKDLIPILIKTGSVYGYIHRGVWSDIGIPQDYAKANFEALKKYFPKGFIGQNTDIGSNVELIPPYYIGNNVKIDKNSVIGPMTILNNNVKLYEGVRIINSIVFSGTIIESYSYIRGAIIGERSYVGRWSRIEEGVVMGDEVIVSEGIYIAPKVTISPYKEVDHNIYTEGRVIL